MNTTFGMLAAAGLLLVRPAMLIMSSTMLGAIQAPAQLRLGLTILVALLLAPVVTLPASLSLGDLTLVIVREAAIGLALSLAIRVLLAAAEFAGHFVGYQIGLSIGSLIDPQRGVNNNILAILYANVAVIICFASNLHHMLLRALADSYRALPVGLGSLNDSLVKSVSDTIGLIFVLGVRIAAPVIVVLLMVELALGIVGRVAPSLNVITAGAPVRVIVGLLVLAASLGALPGLIGRYTPTLFQVASGTAETFR